MCPIPSDPLPTRLLALARQATAQIKAAGADTSIMWLTDVRPDALVWFPLGGAHPLELLLRFVAPAHWTAIGVAGAGSAHTLDASGRPQRGSTLGHVFVTVLVHRSGAATTLMRHGDGEPAAIPEPPEGTVADACRRTLGLPTAGPPASTTGLWSLCWLDRLVGVAAAGPVPRSPRQDWPPVAGLQPATGLGPLPSDPHTLARSPLRDWPSVAGLHPATCLGPVPSDPHALARACKVLAATWPWSRLRSHPEAVDLPGLESPADLARWMDDGMWARWLLSAFPSRDDLLDSVHNLLPSDLAHAITLTVHES